MRRLLLCLTVALVFAAPAALADLPPPDREEPKDSGCQAMPTPTPLLPAAAAAALMALAAVRKR